MPWRNTDGESIRVALSLPPNAISVDYIQSLMDAVELEAPNAILTCQTILDRLAALEPQFDQAYGKNYNLSKAGAVSFFLLGGAAEGLTTRKRDLLNQLKTSLNIPPVPKVVTNNPFNGGVTR